MYAFRLFVCLLFFCKSLNAQQPRLIIPEGHPYAIQTVCFSPDGKLLLTSGYDGSICIWNAKTAQLVRQLKEGKEVFSASFSPDGKKFATISKENIRIWDTQTGGLLHTFNDSNDRFSFAAFSKNSNLLVMGIQDTLVQICNVETGRGVLRFKATDKNEFILDASFSKNDEKLITRSTKKIRVWDAKTGKNLFSISENNMYASQPPAVFSPDGTRVLLVINNILKLLDAKTGEPTTIFHVGDGVGIFNAAFSGDGKFIVASLNGSGTDGAQIFNAQTGAVTVTLENSMRIGANESLAFSPDNSMVAVRTATTVHVWNSTNGTTKYSIPANFKYFFSRYCFSPDSKTIVTTELEIRSWNAGNGEKELLFTGHSSFVYNARFSKDGSHITVRFASKNNFNGWPVYRVLETANGKQLKNKYPGLENGKSICLDETNDMILSTRNDSAFFIDLHDGRVLLQIPDHFNAGSVEKLVVNKSRTQAATICMDSLQVWDLLTGKHFTIKSREINLKEVFFSNNDRYIAVTDFIKGGYRNYIMAWDIRTGKMFQWPPWIAFNRVSALSFSMNDSQVIIDDDNDSISLCDLETGELVWRKKLQQAFFTSDEKGIITVLANGSVQFINAKTGELIWTMGKDEADLWRMEDLVFSDDGKYFYCLSIKNNLFCKRDAATGKRLAFFDLGFYTFQDFNFKNNLLVASDNCETKLFDITTGKHLYGFYAIDSTDYLVTDSKGHFDGSQNAIDLLYLTCNLEVIALKQVKEQLWVPNLAKRIMKSETINEPALSDLEICKLVPLVVLQDATPEGYRFLITPQLGGVGDIIISGNNIEHIIYQKEDLVKTKNGYLLTIGKDFTDTYFDEGTQNELSVKALVKDNSISSAEVIVRKEPSKPPARPTVYALFIGVSDYKGEGLDLHFAAKDAEDLGNVFDSSARKFLNIAPGDEHVFVYRLNTGPNRTGFPDKTSIRKTLEEIGTKAKPNDILLIFFAGHGVMQGAKKQFYFLTADASSNITGEAIEKAGISTVELIDWIQPKNIKAQKRILIFDACNSGQALNDFVKVGGKNQQYFIARSDEESKQIKTIEKLNERSGFFILSASASDQSAYEFDLYSQGLLTYSLLKTIKEDPSILENGKYLDVSKWLNASKELLSDLVKQNNVRQEPQMVNANNFQVGLVDDGIRNQIRLSNEKLMFGKSIFRNTELRIDNLKLGRAVDEDLNDRSSSGTTAGILFNAMFEGADAYHLVCDYTISNEKITASVLIVKDDNTILHELKVNGIKTDLKNLSATIVTEALKLVVQKK